MRLSIFLIKDIIELKWIPDLFMKRVHNDEGWTLFSPNDCPDLHDLTGLKFEKRYNDKTINSISFKH